MTGALTHSPADVVRQFLIDAGLATASGNWPCKVGSEPDSPDNCVTVFDTSGITQGRIQVTGEAAEFHGVQVRVRAIDHPTGYAKIRAILTACDETALRETVTVGGSTYHLQALTRRGGILSLGKDESASKRNLFTVNYLASLHQT